MDCTVHGVTKSWTRLSDFHFHRGMCKYLFKMVILGYISRSGIAGSFVSTTFSIFRMSILFSIIAGPIYIPTNSAQSFAFFHISHEMISHYGFDCTSLLINGAEHLFLIYRVSFLEEL